MVMGSWPLPFFSKSVKPDAKRKRAKKGSIRTPQSATPNTLASYSNALMNRDSFGEKAREAFTVQYSGGPHLVFAENIRPEADYALPQTPFGAMKGAPSLCSPPPHPSILSTSGSATVQDILPGILRILRIVPWCSSQGCSPTRLTLTKWGNDYGFIKSRI